MYQQAAVVMRPSKCDNKLITPVTYIINRSLQGKRSPSAVDKNDELMNSDNKNNDIPPSPSNSMLCMPRRPPANLKFNGRKE